jgi:hypothetical protein
MHFQSSFILGPLTPPLRTLSYIGFSAAGIGHIKYCSSVTLPFIAKEKEKEKV